jgi:hypothetical protein
MRWAFSRPPNFLDSGAATFWAAGLGLPSKREAILWQKPSPGQEKAEEQSKPTPQTLQEARREHFGPADRCGLARAAEGLQWPQDAICGVLQFASWLLRWP